MRHAGPVPSVLTIVIALCMCLGLVGVLLPVLPGLLLISVSAAVWSWQADGSGVVRWGSLLTILAICAAGTVLKYAVPSRSLKEAGAPRLTIAVGVVAAVIGFFAIPVAGVIVGFAVGVCLAEFFRLRSGHGAWLSTWATLKGIGLGMLLELTAGILAVAVWVVAVAVV